MTMINQMGSLAEGTVLRGNYEYQIVREIGRGAMAVVYLARQQNLDRLVALKILSAELSSNKEFVKRFFNEVRTAAALSHPHIIQAYDAGVVEGDVYYFAMEYVDGETLLNRVKSGGRLSPEVALEYGLEIAHALNYGWQRQRLTHGDIKPENIMITSDNQAKLADFGLAKVSGHDYEGSEVMLTPHYAAPELIAGELCKDDCRADIYAFGASLYHLLSGTTPYPGDNGQEVMQMHLSEPLEALKIRCPEVPIFISDYIGLLMEKESGRRPQSWQAVLSGLQVCQERLSQTREKIMGGRKARLNFPVSEHRASANLGRGAVVSGGTVGNGSVASRARQSNRANLLWMLAMVLGIVVLFVLGSLYMLKKNRGVGAVAGDPAAEVSVEIGKTGTELSAGADSEKKNLLVEENTTVSAGTVLAMPVAEEGNGAVEPVATSPELAGVAAAGNEIAGGVVAPVGSNGAATDVAAAVVVAEDVVAEREKMVPTEPIRSVRLPDYRLAVPSGQEAFAERMHFLGLVQALLIPSDRLISAEPLMRRVSDWQKGEELSPANASLALFLREVAIPRLDEANSRLVLRKEQLRGKEIQSTQAGQSIYVIHDVMVSGMVLDKKIGDKGYMRMELGWGRLATERYFDSIYLQAFGGSNDLIDLQCLLSRLLFTGRPDAVEQVLSRNPAMAERLPWQRLAQMVQMVMQNPVWVSKFSEMRQAMRDGVRSQTGRLADDLLRMPNLLPEGKVWCQRILDECAGYVRDIRGGQLIREAGETLESEPLVAYCRLLSAQNLCLGRYPERSALESSLRQSLEKLSGLGWLRGEGERLPFMSWRPRLPLPVWGYLEQPVLAEKRGRRQGTVANEALARNLLNHVEAGNWLAAREASVALTESKARRDDFPVEWHFPLAYAAFLLDLRYSDSLDKALFFLRESSSFLPSDESRAVAQCRVLEGALFCRSRQALNVLSGGLLQDLDNGMVGEEAMRLACRLAVYHVESGSIGRAQRLWPVLRQGLPADSAALSAWLAGRLGGDTGDAVGLPVLSESLEPELLLLILSLSGGEWNATGGDGWILAQMRGGWRGWPLLGGEALYSWLLRRLAGELRRGDVWAAQDLVQAVAATDMPALIGYQSRLQLLRAGLLSLGGGSGGWLDGRELLRANGAASEGERQLLGRDLTVGKVPVGSPTGFYQGWLHTCRGVGADVAYVVPPELQADDLLSAERELGQALAGLAGLLAAGPPVRLPAP